MRTRTPPEVSTRPRPSRPFASAGTIRFLAGACLFLGGVTALGSVAYAINGATQARADVVVPVTARTDAVVDGRGVGGAEASVVVRSRDSPGGGLRLGLPGTPQGTSLDVPRDGLKLRAWDSTVTEQVLNRGGSAVLGLCVGAGVLLLRKLLLSVAEGRPFEPGNAARIAGIAGLVVVGSLASDFLPVFGTNLVLRRVGLADAGSPVYAGSTLSVLPLLVAPLLLALAEAFRRGTELAQDADGLV